MISSHMTSWHMTLLHTSHDIWWHGIWYDIMIYDIIIWCMKKYNIYDMMYNMIWYYDAQKLIMGEGRQQRITARPSLDSEVVAMHKLKGQSSNMRPDQSFKNKELIRLAGLSKCILSAECMKIWYKVQFFKSVFLVKQAQICA